MLLTLGWRVGAILLQTKVPIFTGHLIGGVTRSVCLVSVEDALWHLDANGKRIACG